MPGPFTIPPAAIGQLLAQNDGRVQAYKDKVAAQAEADRMAQQNAQFQAEQQRLATESDRNYGIAQTQLGYQKTSNDIATSQNTRAQTAFDKTQADEARADAFRESIKSTPFNAPIIDPKLATVTDANHPPVGRPPTTEEQIGRLRAQIQGAIAAHANDTAEELNVQLAALTGDPLRKAQLYGVQLQNKGYEFANHIAPSVAEIDMKVKKAQLANYANDTPQARAAAQASLAVLQNNLSRNTYLWERQVDAAYANNPTAIMGDLAKVTAGIQAASKELETPHTVGTGALAHQVMPIDALTNASIPNVGPDGKPFTAPDGSTVHLAKMRELISLAEQDISQAPDPMQKVAEIMGGSNQAATELRASPAASLTIQGFGVQQMLVRKMQTAPAAARKPPPAAPKSGIAGLYLPGQGPQSGPFAAPSGPFSFSQGR